MKVLGRRRSQLITEKAEKDQGKKQQAASWSLKVKLKQSITEE